MRLSLLTIAFLALGLGTALCVATIQLVDNLGTLRAVLWPAAMVADAFPPPCFDRGPGEPPFCEGTPVQIFAGLLGFGVSVLFYASIAYCFLWLSLRRSHADEPAA